jgi:XTP/dITP diphosphohydrolase
LTQLLIATRNPGKMLEFNRLLQDVPYTLVSLASLGITDEVAELGHTFAENAQLKAKSYASKSGLLTLADDSGLEVDALLGAPGVYSARYGDDPNFTDKDRVNLLLQNLKNVPWQQRTARFKCTIAISQPSGLEIVVAGTVDGMIQYEPLGEGGFGYDSIFYLPSYERTTAQLSLEEKNRISHRSEAARKAKSALKRLSVRNET